MNDSQTQKEAPTTDQRCQHGISTGAYPPCHFCEHDRQRAIAENFAAYIVGEHPSIAKDEDHNVSSFMIEFGGGRPIETQRAASASLPDRIKKYLGCYDEVSGVSCPSHELLREALKELSKEMEMEVQPTKCTCADFDGFVNCPVHV